MEVILQIAGGGALLANTAMLGRLLYQAGKLVQKVEDQGDTLKRHDQELQSLRQRA